MSPLDVDPEEVMAGLKEFQRRTVEYVFRRMYLDPDPATRFLIADEVGLGKTLVARGIIAKAIEHLRKIGTDRIDVVYICSNAAIARQNINRLNLFRDQRFELSTRLTLLPIELDSLEENDVNFVSFTPSTTFEHGRQGGRHRERHLLFHMLRQRLGLPERGLSRTLQGGVGGNRWKQSIARWDKRIEPSLHGEFLKALERDPRLLGRLHDVCLAFMDHRGPSVPRELKRRAYGVIGALRATLARTCVGALEPDLIILDEFQRFRHLLAIKEPSDAAQLAQALMGFRDEKTQMDARVILLSATPYRMYTTEQEEDDDHYRDFIETVRFLLNGNADMVESLERDLSLFRRGLCGGEGAHAGQSAIRERIESCLRSVMVRTERVGATVRRDSMLSESTRELPINADDLRGAVAVDSIARAVGANDVVEYWKSSPYLLNLMRPDGYKLKERVREQAACPSDDLLGALEVSKPYLLSQAQVERYQGIDPANARLRSLLEDTVEAGQWQWLWMPPSLPYLEPGGAYSGAAAGTKALVFSAWNVVPDAIAAICSYEAERRMLAAETDLPDYADLHEKKTAPLQYRIETKTPGEARMTGMMTVALFYPCMTLARAVDPLEMAIEAGGKAGSRDRIRAKARHEILERLSATRSWQDAPAEGRVDQRWYWAALAILDEAYAQQALGWVERRNGWRKVASASKSRAESRAQPGEAKHRGSAFGQHLAEFGEAARAGLSLGRPPEDLLDVLADLSLAGPGVCALRALRRIASEADLDDFAPQLSAAAAVSEGLRTLFNLPSSAALLRGGDASTPYWRQVLSYGLNGNLQAVLDEYFHVLRELTGHGMRRDADVLRVVASAAAEALSLRTSRIGVDEFQLNPQERCVDIERFNLRTRFALRFGEMKDDSGQVLNRIESVRQAFNSPFPPFILASTSIGQEGLDFHCYCHAVYHWNLPSNPVDLEQREGRVHRYKGHAVRKNVAKAFGLAELRGAWDGSGDPWQRIFELAASSVPDRAGDLIPYWIYETKDGARIERRVPLLPLSREQGQLHRLKRGLALYRLVFGQPRQQELLEYLENVGELPPGAGAEGICLAPEG